MAIPDGLPLARRVAYCGRRLAKATRSGLRLSQTLQPCLNGVLSAADHLMRERTAAS
jgi:hypothetical protein